MDISSPATEDKKLPSIVHKVKGMSVMKLMKKLEK